MTALFITAELLAIGSGLLTGTFWLCVALGAI